MKTTPTEEQIKAAKKLIAQINGSKGGSNWWNSLTDEEKEERKQKLKESRAKKSTSV